MLQKRYILFQTIISVLAFLCSCSLSYAGEISGHEYVDLGLSVKWATCNIGASSPEKFGDYFAWAETAPKDNYVWNSYRWSVPGNSKSQNNADVEIVKYYQISGDSVFSAEDDAASVIFGELWHTPSLTEFNELVHGCAWRWTDNYNQTGVAGYEGSSKVNGNKIFFPACGEYSSIDVFGDGSSGSYWTSSFSDVSPEWAYSLQFDFDAIRISCDFVYKFSGHCIRPVCR